MRLQDQVAVITGAGSGFGRGTAEVFAAEGARVVVADVDARAGRETVDAIEEAGGTATFVPVDVTENEQVGAMVDAAVEGYGRLDILFNNAGIPMPKQPLEATDEALFDDIFAVNVKGVFLGCKHALPVMKEQGGGVILNMASTASIRPRPGLTAYNASKGAVEVLTKSLALEGAPHNIRVNSLHPVAGDTPMLPRFMGEEADVDKGLAAFADTIPLGRLSQPEDIAYAALYLASEEAGFITGVALEVDGGRDV